MPEMIQFEWQRDDDNVIVSLNERRTIGGKKIVPFGNWPRIAEVRNSPGLGRLLAWIEEGRETEIGAPWAAIEHGKVQLLDVAVAALSEIEASSIGLPASTSLVIELATEGLINEEGFKVTTRWLQPGGRAIRTQIDGAIISYEGTQRRIPEPLFSLYTAALKLSEPLSEEERFAALETLQNFWPDLGPNSVSSNEYLKTIRIQYAAGFSVSLGARGPLDFDPVLFNKQSLKDAETGEILDEELDSVLSPKQQTLFAGDRFVRFSDIRPIYPLEDNNYVFIDPSLRPALKVVKDVQSADPETRRRFLSGPKRYLKDQLAGSELGEFADELFVETEQFSERVVGVDIWKQPILPWIKQRPNTWLPESFGLRVGDEFVEVDPAEISPLRSAVEEAILRGDEFAEVGEMKIPATSQALDALKSIEQLSSAQTDADTEEESPDPPQDLAEKLFLTVSENFEEVEYARLGKAKSVPTDVTEQIENPSRVKTDLKPHQVVGFGWLVNSYRSGRQGVLVADDMGLGKTLQALAFMAWLQDGKRPTRGPALVVAPTGLLANWRKEIETHLDERGLGELVLAFGTDLKRLRSEDGFSSRDIVAGKATLDTADWMHAGVILTTYETMRDYHFSFARIPFELIVFDEIQKLKNHTSQTTRASKTLNAKFAIGLTGTPVENRLQDLWSIVDVLSPGLLGSSKDFEQKYPETSETALSALRERLTVPEDGGPAHMMRRLKEDHLEGLPKKTTVKRDLEMPATQARAYASVVQRAIASRDVMTKRDGMLHILHKMRGISLHPLDPRLAPQDELDDYALDSARLKWTLEILDEIFIKGEKALVFVESLAMQSVLQELLFQRYQLPRLPMLINGSVPGGKRQQMVDRFQGAADGFDVLILSPRAGGVGLTLTAANHVIHLSRWWNPAVEDQSTDRVFRIGQERPVSVYLPLAVHPDPNIGPISFDKKLDALIERKRTLSRDMLRPTHGDDSDIQELFDQVIGIGEVEDLREEQIEGISAELAHDSLKHPLYSKFNAPDVKEIKNLETSIELQKAETESPVTAAVSGDVPQSRWVFESGEERDLREVFAAIAGQNVKTILISDPYAIATPQSRQAIVTFLGVVKDLSGPIDKMIIEYTPVDRLRDYRDKESDGGQKYDLRHRIVGPNAPLADHNAINFKERWRSRDRDFHDRSITIEAGEPDSIPHTYDLSRGLSGLVEPRYECRVYYVS